MKVVLVAVLSRGSSTEPWDVEEKGSGRKCMFMFMCVCVCVHGWVRLRGYVCGCVRYLPSWGEVA